MKITQCTFPETQYVNTESKKSQIYLHHTAGNSDPFAVYKDWATTSTRVATCVEINGNIVNLRGGNE